MDKCQVCGKDYDRLDLERSQGATYWTGKYCSAQCYTKRMLIEEAVARRDSTILSCYKCGATDRLVMISHHATVGLTGFIFVCVNCEGSLGDKNVEIILTDQGVG